MSVFTIALWTCFAESGQLRAVYGLFVLGSSGVHVELSALNIAIFVLKRIHMLVDKKKAVAWMGGVLAVPSS